ncbi:DUF2163 domain-containing protein [Pseudomonas citronellolis]|uniref:DUF2163 domain-containing protein n=1 Tax=Pseudomonas citronellolis TaxID=53408 RepID=A0AAW6P0T4_9PSED|nr:phage BR0599 family protein [Pseudomonas citronellolis]MDF3841110.1 DUF2163 domain-containing protein [Pseudomonas citronellolis]
MTSESRESSWDQGKPVYFFRFTRKTRNWFYTSSDRDEVLLGDIYTHASITRTAIRQGSERARLNITITLPSTLPVAENWRPYPSIDPIAVTAFVRHVGEADALVDWVGRVTASKFKGATLELTCEPTQTRAKKMGDQRAWQRGCGLALYSQGLGQCNVDRSLHAVAATLTAVDRLNVSALEFGLVPNRRLAGGYIEWAQPDGLIEYRTIRDHNGTAITLDYGAADLVTGLAITAYPGCAHTWSDCAYFGARDRYGGDIYMPVDNPYSGDPVW